MLDANLKGQLKAYLANITQPIELVASLDDSQGARELKELLLEIRELSDKITVVEHNDAEVRKPSFLIRRLGRNRHGNVAPRLEQVQRLLDLALGHRMARQLRLEPEPARGEISG